MANPGPNVTTTSNVIVDSTPADGHNTPFPLSFGLNVTPIAQPAGNAQAVISRGLQCGTIASYSSTQ